MTNFDREARQMRCRWCEKSIVPFKGMYGSQWIHEGTWRAECEPWHVAEPVLIVEEGCEQGCLTKALADYEALLIDGQEAP